MSGVYWNHVFITPWFLAFYREFVAELLRSVHYRSIVFEAVSCVNAFLLRNLKNTL